MPCCVFDAFKQALTGLSGNPIAVDEYYDGVKQNSDSGRYCVISSSVTAGVVTTDAVEEVHRVGISGYFGVGHSAEAGVVRGLLQSFVFQPGCLSLGECGCFCVRSRSNLQRVSRRDTLQVSVTLTGTMTGI